MTYWDMDEYQVEDVMTEFLKKSLAQSEFDSTLGWFLFTLTEIYIKISTFMSVSPSSCSSDTLKCFIMLIATGYPISVQLQQTSLRTEDIIVSPISTITFLKKILESSIEKVSF